MSPPPPLCRREFAVNSVLAALASGTVGQAKAADQAGPDPARPRRGIWKPRRNPMMPGVPADMPDGAQWRYGLDFPFQVAPNLGGLYCNVKIYGGPGQDFEGGADIVLIDRLDVGGERRTVAAVRNSTAPNPHNGGRPATMMKYPGLIGFVPLGAKGDDGRPHPHGGTGFVLATAAAWPAVPGELPPYSYPDRIGQGPYPDARSYRCFELRQLRYDGRDFIVGPPQQIEQNGLLEGFRFHSGGLGCALADGVDLITGLTAVREGGSASAAGLVRWRRVEGAWRPVGFEFVTPEDDSVEPALLRDLDGSLLMYARASRAMGPRVRLWRQGPGGGPWVPRLNVGGMIANAALSLGRAVDGTPYVVANLYQPEFPLPEGLHAANGVSRLEPAGRRGERSTLCLWPLNEARDGFAGQFVLRDPLVEFGPPPQGTVWAADHPCGGLVRLGDGRWRALVGWRLLEWKENSHQIPPGPRTGSYLDEVLSVGPPVPLWKF